MLRIEPTLLWRGSSTKAPWLHYFSTHWVLKSLLPQILQYTDCFQGMTSCLQPWPQRDTPSQEQADASQPQRVKLHLLTLSVKVHHSSLTQDKMSPGHRPLIMIVILFCVTTTTATRFIISLIIISPENTTI